MTATIVMDLQDTFVGKKLEQSKKRIAGMRNRNEPIPIEQFIFVHMIFDHEDGGWVHTHGMWELFGLPDLEIRRVNPIFMLTDAGLILNHIAQYMVDMQGQKEVKPGQNMGIGHGRFVFFEESKPIDPNDGEETETHFKTPRLLVKDVPGAQVCEKCSKGEKHAKHS